MTTMICSSCNDEVTKNPKLKGRQQNYCGKTKCQRARKAAWKRDRLRSSPEFRSDHALANRKWSATNPEYWRQYRLCNPERAERNRLLQQLRNQRISPSSSPKNCKGRRVNIQTNQLVGQFWLVPVIAKVDALKVNIAAIRAS